MAAERKLYHGVACRDRAPSRVSILDRGIEFHRRPARHCRCDSDGSGFEHDPHRLEWAQHLTELEFRAALGSFGVTA